MLPELPGATAAPNQVDRQLERLGEQADSQLGPASGVRHVSDTFAVPLARTLGMRVLGREDTPVETRLTLGGDGPALVPLFVRGWAEDLDVIWKELVQRAIAQDARWCVTTNGRIVRIVDGQRTWSRACLDIDVTALGHQPWVRQLLWTVANSQAITQVPAVLDSAVLLSAEHGAQVCRALGDGVSKALRGLFGALRPGAPALLDSPRLLEQCLTVIYRVLFLLFAEARGLVPVWHPLYRDSYTIGSIVSTLMAGRPSRGTWRAVQAISRMAHAGCAAGSMSVTAFNGRLFSPRQTAGIDERRISDEVMQQVILGLSTIRLARTGVVRTRYDELDVEQLGSVYEHVLEYQPGPHRHSPLVRTRDARKASGTFYTPREIAASLVEHTLEPLVSGRTADEILRLRVLDPAMGSGAFLVAACRYLASHAEKALVDEGRWHATDVTDADRTGLRRDIVQRCLYGVDLNPVAVQLARLSLWLVALAHDKPLSFLDHHLVVGNSLIGASPPDIQRPTGGSRHTRLRGALPLFDESQLDHALSSAVRIRQALALEPDDAASGVRSKEQRLASLVRPGSPLGAWKRVLDLWCATWFWDDGAPPGGATFRDAADELLAGHSDLGPRLVETLLARADRIADAQNFLHWPLVFPEVFQTEGNDAPAGFDAVIGNPPWDMVRGDAGDDDARSAGRDEARYLTRFIRDAGIYRADARAHVNRYALFTERALQLVRRTGRVGLVLPAGMFTDTGTAPLRMHLLSAASVDGVVGLDNRTGIFPIHRSTKFVLLTATAGSATRAIKCRFGVSQVADVHEAWSASKSLVVTRALLERVSGGDDLSLPTLTSADDLRIVETLSASAPTLAEASGWNVRFGRELNASDDRALMVPRAPHSPGRPVVEGKALTPFKVRLSECRLELVPGSGRRRGVPRHARLAYRDVSGASNRLTLIAAIVPAHAATVHTVFCLKSPLPLDAQHVLCALLNSFVANYLVRMRVGTHVTAAIMSRLRVPMVAASSGTFVRLAQLARVLADSTSPAEKHPGFIELQAIAGRLYGLTEADFAHVLGTFPLIPPSIREACLRQFTSTRIDG